MQAVRRPGTAGHSPAVAAYIPAPAADMQAAGIRHSVQVRHNPMRPDCQSACREAESHRPPPPWCTSWPRSGLSTTWSSTCPRHRAVCLSSRISPPCRPGLAIRRHCATRCFPADSRCGPCTSRMWQEGMRRLSVQGPAGPDYSQDNVLQGLCPRYRSTLLCSVTYK